MKRKMSLSLKLVIVMLLLVTGTICLCWFINNTFLEDFYTYNKQKDLIEGYKTLDDASEDGTLENESFDIAFERLSANGNLNIIVLGEDASLLRSSAPDFQTLMMQLQELLGGEGRGNQSELVAATDDYILQRQFDPRLQSEYLVLWGTLEGGEFVYIRTALESVRESAMITNQFFLMVGCVGIVISAIVILVLARSITKPIKELTNASKAMSNLEFEVKYIPKKQDSAEIAELGAHMNVMSQTLERTISELKSANNELKQDIRKKEEIDEMRKEFLSNVSHELKTPLALIQGYAEGLKEGVNDDEESRDYYCDVIIDESNKMNTMVKKILSLNHLEFGNDAIEMTRFDITELLSGLVQTTKILAQSDGVDIEFMEKEPVYVWGDEFKVEEVLTNYISNALHHAAGEKKIRIYYEKREEILRICVSNTGNQIPEEELDKIWIKFYKVDKARTREYGGSGIGLSIVKAIMDSMHQGFGVRNLEDGVEFWMELESGCIKE